MAAKTLFIPRKIRISVSSPMECLQSMGLMSTGTAPLEPDVQKTIDHVKANEALATSAVWSRVGGIKIAFLVDTVVIHDNGDVEGPSHPEDLQTAPSTFCKVRDAKSGVNVIALLAVNGISKVADVCIYDPLRTAKEEILYSVAGSIGGWLRILLGEGWGLRIEVYCERYAPSEVPEMTNLWMLLMVMLKAYLPHVRMIDTQAAFRVECMAKHISMRDALTNVLLNISKEIPSA
jgi:hypothetical protein